ncbi:MAG: hypothetical protein WD355_06515 [Balneolaceae bacterium]
MLEDNLTLVIRSVHERTESLCRDLLLEQGVPERNIHVIHETPFSKAMEVSYRIGLDEERPWTWCLDADVLLHGKAVEEMMSAAGRAPDHVFGLSGKLLDKLFGGWRAVGNHLFRTSSLEQMISHIAEYETEGIRPESDAKSKLEANGLEWQKINLPIGLHDYEQHYTDIARKSYVHARKHVIHLDELAERWIRNSAADADYKAALIGLSRGLADFGKIKIDVEKYEDLRKEVIQTLGEKGTEPSDFQVGSCSDVQAVISSETKDTGPAPVFQGKHEKIYKEAFNSRGYRDLFGDLKKRIKKELKEWLRGRK